MPGILKFFDIPGIENKYYEPGILEKFDIPVFARIYPYGMARGVLIWGSTPAQRNTAEILNSLWFKSRLIEESWAFPTGLLNKSQNLGRSNFHNNDLARLWRSRDVIMPTHCLACPKFLAELLCHLSIFSLFTFS